MPFPVSSERTHLYWPLQLNATNSPTAEPDLWAMDQFHETPPPALLTPTSFADQSDDEMHGFADDETSTNLHDASTEIESSSSESSVSDDSDSDNDYRVRGQIRQRITAGWDTTTLLSKVTANLNDRISAQVSLIFPREIDAYSPIHFRFKNDALDPIINAFLTDDFYAAYKTLRNSSVDEEQLTQFDAAMSSCVNHINQVTRKSMIALKEAQLSRLADYPDYAEAMRVQIQVLKDPRNNAAMSEWKTLLGINQNIPELRQPTVKEKQLYRLFKETFERLVPTDLLDRNLQ